MRERCRRAVAWGSMVVVIAASAPVGAQPKPKAAGAQAQGAAGSDAAREAASAQQMFDAAQKLYDQRKYEEALALFRQVYAKTKSPNAHIMVGSCLIALGRSAEAYDELEATMREAARRAEAETKYAAARDSAAQQLAVLEPKIGKVIVVIADPGHGGSGAGASARAHSDASVTLNGALLSRERVGVPVAVEPGNVVVEVTPAGGGPTTRREAAVGPGETKTIALVIGGQKEAAPPPSPVRTDEVETQGGGVRTAGFVVAGVGVAGMAVFGVAGMMVRGKLGTLQEECGGARCTDPKYGDVIDSGKTLALVTNIGLGVGIAGLVGGGLMIALGGPKKVAGSGASGTGEERPAAALGVGVSPGGATVRVAGTF